MDLYVGIDIGTSGTKVCVVNADGVVLQVAAFSYSLEYPRSGWAEQDPIVWWQAVVSCFRQLAMSDTRISLSEVRGVGMSGQMHTPVLLDAEESPLRKAINWSDQRTGSQCRYLRSEVGDEVLRRTGNPISTGFSWPKLIWIQENEPELFKKVAWIVLPKDYVRYRLTGEICTDYSDASGTLLFDAEKQEWMEDLIHVTGIPSSVFPQIKSATEIAGYVTHNASSETGLPVDIPVVTGSADVPAAVRGAGSHSPGGAVISMGTAAQVIVRTENPIFDSNGRLHLLSYGERGAWLTMAAMQNAGLVLDWFRREFCRSSESENQVPGTLVETLTESLDHATEVVRSPLFLPYLTGERTPHMSESAAGVLFGLRPNHTRADVLHAILEGISFATRECFEIIGDFYPGLDEAFLTGGIANNAYFGQLLSSVLHKKLNVSLIPDASAVGAAIMAHAGATGENISIQAPLQSDSRSFTPEASYRSNLDERYEVFRSVYAHTTEDFRKLYQLLNV